MPFRKMAYCHLHILLALWIEWNIIMQLNEKNYNFPLIIASLNKITIVCNIRCELIISFSRNLKSSKKTFQTNICEGKQEYYCLLWFLYFKLWNLQNNIISRHYNVDLAMVHNILGFKLKSQEIMKTLILKFP
jgi:hypothetical protein